MANTKTENCTSFQRKIYQISGYEFWHGQHTGRKAAQDTRMYQAGRRRLKKWQGVPEVVNTTREGRSRHLNP